MDVHCSITCLLFVFYFAEYSKAGSNIMVNKPSIQSSTREFYQAYRGNDGTGDPSWTTSEQNPYWQGDLLGYYTVTAINVTSSYAYDWPRYLMNASIGVSFHDISCSGGASEVTKCGQYPDEFAWNKKMTFSCPDAGPVRYVRVWRDVLNNSLNIGEVEVEGEPATTTGRSKYDGFMQKKVNTPITSLTVSGVTDCGNMCHRNQPCIAFSYSPSEQPNCLLATDVTMTSDASWVSYSLQPCLTVTGCNLFD